MDTPDDDARHLIERYFGAMRRGLDAAADLASLFHPDVVYEEPFSGEDEPAVGRDSVMARFRRGWEDPLPAMELDVLHLRLSGGSAEARWECRSPALPGGAVQGVDRYEFADGAIVSLRVSLDGFDDEGTTRG